MLLKFGCQQLYSLAIKWADAAKWQVSIKDIVIGSFYCIITRKTTEGNMKLQKVLLLAALYALTLVGCGGGGEGGGGSTATGGTQTGGSSTGTVSNPLSKYEGVFYHCDGNDRASITLRAQSSDSMSITFTNDIYSNDNCSGNILGTQRISNITATYKGQTIATMPPVTLFPTADYVDSVLVSSVGATRELTGPGVQGVCVKYSYTTSNGSKVNGESCLEPFTPEVANGGIYLSADKKYLVDFGLENGVLTAYGIYSRDPSFNYNTLVRD